MMITDIHDYFSKGCGRCNRFATPDCSTKKWEQGLAMLREMCTGIGLTETVKWGHPCSMHSNRNIAVIGAYRADFRISFFDAALLRDTHQVVERSGPNTAHPDVIRFTSTEQVAQRQPIVESYLRELMGYAQAGIRPKKANTPLYMPSELADALEIDSELRTAFHGLTPGRQKSYVIAIGSAKKSETKISRIATFRDKIIAGKGALDR